jgi:hypothetical protein
MGGGAIYNEATNVMIKGTNFINNSAGFAGGAVYIFMEINLL